MFIGESGYIRRGIIRASVRGAEEIQVVDRWGGVRESTSGGAGPGVYLTQKFVDVVTNLFNEENK